MVEEEKIVEVGENISKHEDYQLIKKDSKLTHLKIKSNSTYQPVMADQGYYKPTKFLKKVQWGKR